MRKAMSKVEKARKQVSTIIKSYLGSDAKHHLIIWSEEYPDNDPHADNLFKYLVRQAAKLFNCPEAKIFKPNRHIEFTAKQTVVALAYQQIPTYDVNKITHVMGFKHVSDVSIQVSTLKAKLAKYRHGIPFNELEQEIITKKHNLYGKSTNK